MTDTYHHLREVRRALHDPRGPKAAVMVGAGFSRNAEPTGNPGTTFPDWTALTRNLVKRLYPSSEEYKGKLAEAGAISSALRLAQEFEVAFGRPALIDLVRESIRDDDFVPGDIHRMLMELPWSDVFTTNYDRLLERAAERIWNRKYDLVLNSDDLPLARRPRIIKLHGTLPDLRGLVLTEDDFRAYPRQFAPFVNSVQSSLSENIFCLVGFSANDPNFLAWSGWVRDELASSAPYMFLFTGDEIRSFQRQLLEARRIIPISILELAQVRDYNSAYRWRFDQLRRRLDTPKAPWNSIPGYASVFPDDNGDSREPIHRPLDKSQEEQLNSWPEAAVLWRKNRLDYKGWHVLNRTAIQHLWTATQFWIRDVSPKLLDQHGPGVAIFILHELVWRYERCLMPLPDSVVFDVIEPAITAFRKWLAEKPDRSIVVHGEQISFEELSSFDLKLSLERLRHAREIGDWERFQQLLTEVSDLIEARKAAPQSNDRQFVIHQRVLYHLCRLEHVHARELLQSWDVSNANMVWTVRRAGLLLECGLLDIARRSLVQLLTSLRRIPATAEAHIPQLSAEGLLLMLFWYVIRASEWEAAEKQHKGMPVEPVIDRSIDERTLRGRLDDLRKLGCNPLEVLDWLSLANESKTEDESTESEEDSYQCERLRGSNRLSGDDERSRLAYQGLRFIEDAGLPLLIHGVVPISVAAQLFADATLAVNRFSFHEAIGPILRACNDKLVKRCLTHDRLYRLPTRHLESLKQTASAALQTASGNLGPPPKPRESEDEWREKQFLAALLVESRLVFRLHREELVELLRLTIPLMADSRTYGRWSERRELFNLNECGLKALDNTGVANLLPLLVSLPLPGSEQWPSGADLNFSMDPVGSLMDASRRAIHRVNEDVSQGIQKCLSSSAGDDLKLRANAILRLATLHWVGILNLDEQKQLAVAMYRHCDAFGLPSETNCLDSFVLYLPQPDGINEAECFRKKYVLSEEMSDKYWRQLCQTVDRFRVPVKSGRRSITWTSEDLDLIINRSEKWLGDVAVRVAEGKEHARKHPYMAYFAGLVELEKTCDYFITAMESVILLDPSITNKQVERVANLLHQAQQAGLETVLARPALLYHGADTLEGVLPAVQEAMVSQSDQTLRQGREAIIRLCQLSEQSGGKIDPDAVLVTLGSFSLSPLSPRLPQLLLTASDVIKILGKNSPSGFIARLQQGLGILLKLVNYDDDELELSITSRVSIRKACAAVAVSLKRADLANASVDEWIETAKTDSFPEVRREIEGD